MKNFYFKRLKGKVNPNPHKITLGIKEERLTEEDRSYVIHCINRIEFNKTLNFLKTHIFLNISTDDKELLIYMPKSYILMVESVSDI